jgi:coronin-1B/1C/6
MSHFVRASKYRHVFVEQPKVQDTFTSFRLSTAVGEQNYVKGNPKYFAVALSVRGKDKDTAPPHRTPCPTPHGGSTRMPHTLTYTRTYTRAQGGGGPFTVMSYKNTGPVAPSVPVFSGHTGNVLDFDFNPFHDQIIASGAEDLTVKVRTLFIPPVLSSFHPARGRPGRDPSPTHPPLFPLFPQVWGIPEGGLTENIADPLQDLRGHEKKVTLLRFHPTAANVLATASFDNTVKLWDIETGAEMVTCAAHEQLIQDVVWDHRGNLYATTSKDKVLRLIDARTGGVAQVGGHAALCWEAPVCVGVRLCVVYIFVYACHEWAVCVCVPTDLQPP